jgi:hypothetical protein
MLTRTHQHNNHPTGGDYCMKGIIISDEHCSICGGVLRHDENRGGLFCLKHPDQFAVKTFRVKFGRGPTRRFKTYHQAIRCLTGWRYKTDEGIFDARDYKKSNPLGFQQLADNWLKTKASVSGSHLANLTRWIDLGAKSWGPDTNVRIIGFGQVEDLLLSLSVSDKTKYDMVNCFSQFFNWVEKREGLPAPDLPEIEYTLGWRNIIPIDLQQRIIAEVKVICPNVRVWIGIKWLSTYVAMRPKEMWSLKEKQINVDGYFILPPMSSKERKPKLVPMLEEDIELYRSLPQGLPDLPFFRRHKGRGVARPGEQMSKRAFYRWWKKACGNLGVTDVDLYGGTRHSTTSAMGEYFTKEEVREMGTQHGTNKAFERYFRTDVKPKRTFYEKVRELQGEKKKTGRIISL